MLNVLIQTVNIICGVKAEIKLSGERLAARFACGTESLAASAVYSFKV